MDGEKTEPFLFLRVLYAELEVGTSRTDRKENWKAGGARRLDQAESQVRAGAIGIVIQALAAMNWATQLSDVTR
jgi:hypothetical protein